MDIQPMNLSTKSDAKSVASKLLQFVQNGSPASDVLTAILLSRRLNSSKPLMFTNAETKAVSIDLAKASELSQVLIQRLSHTYSGISICP